jgi:hypothetical protein
LDNSTGNQSLNLSGYWQDFTAKEKRTLIEQLCEKIVVGRFQIEIEFGCAPNSLKTAADGQQNETGNETQTVEPEAANVAAVSEPLLSEAAAANFLGVSKITLLRKRNNGEIGFFRVGFRVLYSKEKHLLPFRKRCEKGS